MSNKAVAFFSRPVLTGASTGTGISACALRIYQALEKTHYIRTYTSFRSVPAYHSILSVLVYDFLSPFIFLIKNFRQRFDSLFFIEPSQAIWIGLLAVWYKPVNVCVLVHDCFFLENMSPYSLYSRYFYRKAIRRSTKILTTTYENAEQIFRVFGRMAQVLPLGPSLDTDTPLSDPNQIKYNHEPLRIGYIGSSVPRKRLLSFLKLIKKLAHEEIVAEYILAGPIDAVTLRTLRLSVEAHAKYATLRYLGCISEAEKPEFYHALHVLFFPTSLEGYGMPVVEAAYFGLPCFVLKDARLPRFIKNMCFEDTEEFLEIQRYVAYMSSPSSESLHDDREHYLDKILRNQAEVRCLDWNRFSEVV